MKKITIIIVNWNNQKDLLECLDSLNKVVVKNYQLSTVIVDNASDDDSVTKVKSKYPDINLIVNSHNLGFAEGNNCGIKFAIGNKADYILLLNNDTIVDKNFLPPLLNSAENDLSLALISPKIYFSAGYEYHLDCYKNSEQGKVIWYAGGIIDWDNIICSHRGVDEVDKGQYDTAVTTDFNTGCCVLIRTNALTKIGLFNPKYYLYFEDVDLSIRAKKAGFRIFYEPKSFIWHKNASSSGKPGSALHNYYLTRNRLLFGFNYASPKTKMALLKNAFFLYKRNLPGERKGVFDFFLGRFGKGNINGFI